ncbi:hypothetical protein B0I35DRAFT_474817 [Stachybotrys elegans]|uniref:C2H2-type domain-containing protein n=1 Tax=Stachybotrys elegans TaxID=80388 RepID=A0A8K0T1C2_9HYPO|nr:hypothetical protein B0I35DRAFT_474817 [Stachybotrys elegans]
MAYSAFQPGSGMNNLSSTSGNRNYHGAHGSGNVQDAFIDPNLSNSFPILHDQGGFSSYNSEMPYPFANPHAATDMFPLPLGRHGSPFSQANMQSPRPESDGCTQGPATPSDPPAYTQSPLITGQYIPSHANFVSRSMMPEAAHVHDTGYINPSALSPSPDINYPLDGRKSPSHHEFENCYLSAGDPTLHLTATSFTSYAEPTSHLSPGDTTIAFQDEIHVRPLPSSPFAVSDDGRQGNGMQASQGFSATSNAFSPPRNHGQQSRSSEKTNRQRAKSKRRFRASDTMATSAPLGSSIPLPLSPSGSLKLCSPCNRNFKDSASLKKHVQSDHTRPYTCVFSYAGCTSNFASKNEWKRHVSSQHLGLVYWVCAMGSCAKNRGSPSHQRSTSLPETGAIFNRKDLFTQHVRRMHYPSDQQGKSAQRDEHLHKLQVEAKRVRCQLPTHMRCPSTGCSMTFDGEGAWDQRMEHVARHLDAVAKGQELPISFGGNYDTTLTAWAERKDVDIVRRTANSWELCNPLKGDNGGRHSSAGSFQRDADGEDY